MTRKRHGFAWAVASVVAGGLLLTACFTANLGGTAASPSPITAFGPTGPTTKKVEFSLISKDSFGTGLGGTNGFLKDNGANPLFPRGVKLSFRNGLSAGIGWDCSDVIGGPSRRVHGGTSTTISPTDLCSMYSDPRVWFGLVTYSSADQRYYSNQGFPPCNEYYQAYLSEFAGGLFLRKPISRKGSAVPDGENIAGFGVVTIVDTNYNRNYDHGDRFGFVSVCGPYTHLDGTGLLPGSAVSKFVAGTRAAALPSGMRSMLSSVAPSNGAIYPSDPSDYNYASCSWTDGPFPAIGGAVPSQVIDEDPELAFELSMLCAMYQPGTTGDLKIGVATRLTTTTTTASTVAPVQK